MADKNEESNSAGLGVMLELPAETVNRLKTHQPQQQQSSRNQSELKSLRPRTTIAQTIAKEPNFPGNFEAPAEGDDGYVNIRSEDPDDNWNDILAVPVGEPEALDTEDPEIGEDDDETGSPLKDERATDESGSEDEISLSPPPHLPVVLIDIKKLVGYQPSSDEEMEQLEHQIRSTLWHGSTEAAVAKSSSNPQEDDHDNIEKNLDAAQHFENRVTELLESGVAQHSTTQDQDGQRKGSCIVVPYPEFLCTPKDPTAAFASPVVLATSQMWKRLIRSHPIPVVNRLLHHLQKCNRSLVWKHAMHQELWTLAKKEEQARVQRHQQLALKEWKYGRRKQQLEQLYQVRETLEFRYSMAKAKVKELEHARDQAVAQELRQRRLENGVGVGLEAFDLNSTILAFPTDNTWLGLEDEDEGDGGYDDQIGPSFVSDDERSQYSGYDAESDDLSQQNGTSNEEERLRIDSSPLENVLDRQELPKRDSKARRDAAAKKRRKRLEEAAKEAEHKAKLDKALGEEERMRDMLTSNDLKMAQAITATLERKVESIDELLESLQEEEWADEEAGEEDKELVPLGDVQEIEQKEDTHFCLLDQILAMILGSLPPLESSKSENITAEHTRNLQAEHLRIIKEWKEHFGRVPPSLQSNETGMRSSGQRQAELKSGYGIVDNEQGDWEDNSSVEDADSNIADTFQPCTASPQEEPTPAATEQPTIQRRKVGLRPGGRIT